MKPQSKDAEDPELAARKAGIERARKEVAAGKGIAHGKIRSWLLGLAAGKKKPRPT